MKTHEIYHISPNEQILHTLMVREIERLFV